MIVVLGETFSDLGLVTSGRVGGVSKKEPLSVVKTFFLIPGVTSFVGSGTCSIPSVVTTETLRKRWTGPETTLSWKI